MPTVQDRSSLIPYPMDAPLPHRIQIDLSGGDFEDNANILTILGQPGTRSGNTTDSLEKLAVAKSVGRKYATVTRFKFRSGLEFGGDRPFAHPVAGEASIHLDDPEADFNPHNKDSVLFPPPPDFKRSDDKRIRRGMQIRIDFPESDFDSSSADRQRLPDNTVVRVFGRFPMWQGSVESVTFVPQTGGHRAIIKAYGPLAEYAREQITMAARWSTHVNTPLQAGEILGDIIAQVHGIAWNDPMKQSKLAAFASASSLYPGVADNTTGLRIWYTADESNALEAIEDLVTATGSIIFEGRQGKLQYRTRANHPMATRVRSSQALIIDRSPEAAKAVGVISKSVRERIRSQTSSDRVSSLNEPIVYVQLADAQPAEAATLTKITYKRLTMRVENATIWELPDPLDIAPGGEEDITVNADLAEEGTVGISIWNAPVALTQAQIAWTDPSDASIPQGVLPNPARVSVTFVYEDINNSMVTDGGGRQGGNFSHTLRIEYTPFQSEPQANVTISGIVLTGDQVIVTEHETQTVRSNYASGRAENYENKFIEEPVTRAQRLRDPLTISRISNIEETLRDIINLYEINAFRPILEIDAAAAGRWAVEELLVPFSRITLYLPFAGYSSHSYYVRSVIYEATPADEAKLTLQLQPTQVRQFRLGASALGGGDSLGEIA